jgi:hypothetical protein
LQRPRLELFFFFWGLAQSPTNLTTSAKAQWKHLGLVLIRRLDWKQPRSVGAVRHLPFDVAMHLSQLGMICIKVWISPAWHASRRACMQAASKAPGLSPISNFPALLRSHQPPPPPTPKLTPHSLAAAGPLRPLQSTRDMFRRRGRPQHLWPRPPTAASPLVFPPLQSRLDLLPRCLELRNSHLGEVVIQRQLHGSQPLH